MTRSRSQSGITLMELMISITLLSMLALGMLFAFRIGLSAMSRSSERAVANRRVLGVERALTQQIAGFIPAKAYCQASPEQPIQHLPFFQGDPQTMRFVSSYSLQEASRGYARILEFQVIPSNQNQGVRLIVNERLYTGPLSTGALCLGMVSDPASGVTRTVFRPVEVGPLSFVLADNLSRCDFFFKDETNPDEPVWRPSWVRDTTPSAVRIQLVPLEPDPSKIHVPTITVSFRPNRHAMKEFVDYK
ncbi:MAG TPA: prepilin-type N-terminal cleavage/methylation domain-containing protein [Bryobacteraceae bacterium]|nr:prepilin-type N-terminal cleavage/methylation domain-containing protein [Bryobacteraceae bacterium]